VLFSPLWSSSGPDFTCPHLPVEISSSVSPQTSDSLSGETSSIDQSSTGNAKQPPSTNTDLDQVLQEAQASLKSIPNLDLSDTRVGHSESASGQNLPLDLSLQG